MRGDDVTGDLPVQTIAEEDEWRARVYTLLGRMLAEPPSEELLGIVRGLSGDESPLGKALSALGAVARDTNLEQARAEYAALFVGMVQGELQPFGSYYLTGFLHEKPLAELRTDLAQLGIARAEGVVESEDHIATLCECMAGLILGEFGAPDDLPESEAPGNDLAENTASQQQFFDKHIASWAPRFFEDLQGAKAARLYMPLGAVGAVFLEIETHAFAMAA